MAEAMVVDTDFGLDGFDLEAYLSDYAARARIRRLLFIAGRSVGKPLELEAYRHAVTLLKEGLDVEKYSEVIEQIGGRLGTAYALDEAWIEGVQKKVRERQEELEKQLRSYKSNMIKDSIRLGHNDLAAFYLECGQLQEALKEYSKTRDYCTTPRHSLMLCLNTMRVALEMDAMAYLTASLRKTDQLLASAIPKAMGGQINCFRGLRELDARRYKSAAAFFVQVDPEINGTFADVMSSQDICIYGALCALATFDRSELKSKVISSISFKEFLESHPNIRSCVHDFYHSQYAACFSRLEKLKPMLLLDLYLHEHAMELYALIRQSALVQFVTPYHSVSLRPMSEAFNVSMSDLVEELVALIGSRQISARIDTEKALLCSSRQATRRPSFSSAVALTKKFLQEHKAMLVRLNLIKHELIQKPSITPDRTPKKSATLEFSSEASF